MERDGRPEGLSGEDLAALGHLTSAWRQVSAIRGAPPDELLRLLNRLGVPREDGSRALTLIEQLHQVIVPEPGLMLNDDDDDCGLGWQPSVLAPVFYGTRQVPVASGSPMRLGVSFPSTDGSPDTGLPLAGCGRYPLVLFLHGSCREPDHFRRWDLLAARLARAGYVVAVPELDHTLAAPWDDPAPLVPSLEQLLIWIRSSWEFAEMLLPRPATAIVGHSYGALVGGRLVARQRHPFSAYVSLSGTWREWSFPTPNPLFRLGTASLFAWGTDTLSDASADLGEWWSQLDFVKHRLTFPAAEHWDYLGPDVSTCASLQGDCPSFVRDLAADFVLTFLSHYLPPERWWLLPETIPHTLLAPPLELSPAQETFMAGHLAGFARTGGRGSCSVTHAWQVNADAGSVTLIGH